MDNWPTRCHSMKMKMERERESEEKFLPSYGMKIKKKDLNKSPDQMSVLMLHYWRVKTDL